MKNGQIFTTLIAVSFILIVGIVVRYTGAADVAITVEIINTAPTVDTIRVATTAYGADSFTVGGILPTIGADRTIHVNGQITDLNGEVDIASSTIALVFFRTSKTNSCTADKNDCYRITTCATNYTDGDDTQISYNCEVPLAYWIDATDSASEYASDTWTSYVVASDVAAAQAALSATIEVNSLLALNLPDAIDYSNRTLGEQSSGATNVETILTQRGNTKADVEVSGTTMSCSVLGTLPISAQKWALTDIGAASSTTLTGTLVATERNINLRTDDVTELSANLYWNIVIPAAGVKGTCTGANTILIITQAATPVASLVSGPTANHSFSVAAGTLWAWGNNTDRQLGLGDTAFRVSPVKVGTSTNWSLVTSGSTHTHAIKTNGTLWAWGNNTFGELGLGDVIVHTLPTQIGSATNWSQVTAAELYSLAIKTDGTLWAWGRNNVGQLGLGNTTQQTSPTQVGSATNWSKVAAGNSHTLAIKTDGTLYSWGYNGYGQLGLDDVANRLSPTQVGSLTTWSQIIVGSYHTLAIKTDGTLWAWGRNLEGELGLGDASNRDVPIQVGVLTTWSQVIAGRYHTLAIKTDGTLYSWGYNFYGQLGLALGDTTNRSSPVQVGSATNWSEVTAGYNYTLASRADGTLWAWGINSVGQLGLGDTTNRTVPTEIPSSSFAILPQRERRTRAV